MTRKNSQLIIWDFDGVISDTEHLWIKNWIILLKKYFNVDWDFEIGNHYLGGTSPKTKIEILKQLHINITPEFLQELKELDWQAMEKITAVPGVEDIFKLTNYTQCIATGGNLDKTEKKLEVLGFDKYFSTQDIYTAQQVEKGKPEPDLFLFAAEKSGFAPQKCIVIEDSLAGLTAGLKAGMKTFAFLGCEMNNNPEYIQKVKDLGVKNIFFDMIDIKRLLL